MPTKTAPQREQRELLTWSMMCRGVTAVSWLWVCGMLSMLADSRCTKTCHPIIIVIIGAWVKCHQQLRMPSTTSKQRRILIAEFSVKIYSVQIVVVIYVYKRFFVIFNITALLKFFYSKKTLNSQCEMMVIYSNYVQKKWNATYKVTKHLLSYLWYWKLDQCEKAASSIWIGFIQHVN